MAAPGTATRFEKVKQRCQPRHEPRRQTGDLPWKRSRCTRDLAEEEDQVPPPLIPDQNQARQRRSRTSERAPQLSMDPHTRGTNPRHSAAAQGDNSDAHTRTTKLSVNTSPKVELSRAWQRVLRPQAHTQCLSTRLKRGLSQTPNATAYQENKKD